MNVESIFLEGGLSFVIMKDKSDVVNVQLWEIKTSPIYHHIKLISTSKH